MTDILQPLSPPLKWAGGKRWALPLLGEILPLGNGRRLVEPCMGALSVTLGLRPAAALANDVNPHLVNFYQQIKAGLVFDLPYGHDENDYYAARGEFNAGISAGQIDTPRMAMLFYYLNRTGFNGLCRFNKSGLFNVPFGRYKSINYRSDFFDLQPALSAVEFSLGDFSTLPYKDGDVIYVDPPYDMTFTAYSSGGFSWDDQQRLAGFFAELGLPVAISNSSTERLCQLYGDLGFEVREIAAPRRISSDGSRQAAREILAVKNL